MRVALVHDDLMQWGGAERVLLGLCEIYPDAPVFTSVYDSSNKILSDRFSNKRIITSFLQKIPGWKKLYKTLLPLYPLAFEQFDFSDYDLVISHTTRFAKSIITKPQTKHICYCHTPPRFLWHLSLTTGFGLAELLMTKLRLYDQVSANRVDYFLAGSENAKKRIRKIYHQDSKVVYPFIDLNRFKSIENFDGGYFVVISRLNKYKRVDLAIEACKKLGLHLKIIGIGPHLNRLKEIRESMGDKDNKGDIEFIGMVDDRMVVEVLAGCEALVIPGEEDFGLTSLEAQAMGKPVIAFKVGGVLETVTDGETGIFFNTQSVESLIEAIKRLKSIKINPDNCKANAKRFSKEGFIKDFKEVVASLV